MTGAGVAPAINIVGSYFPAWMLCVLIGVTVSALIREVFVIVGFESALPLAPLTHLGIAIAATLAAWLVWFAH